MAISSKKKFRPTGQGDTFEDGNFDGWDAMGTDYTAVVDNTTATEVNTLRLQNYTNASIGRWDQIEFYETCI
jgi:hypothetical protein